MLRLNGDLSKNIYLKKNITSVTSHLYLDNQYNPPNITNQTDKNVIIRWQKLETLGQLEMNKCEFLLFYLT